MTSSHDADKNRYSWDRWSDDYQAQHGPQLDAAGCAWGVWALPEKDVRALGDISGRKVLELGCGAAQWSIALAEQGAFPIGLDNSSRQLDHARRLIAESDVDLPLVQGTAEDVPFEDESFDVVMCDHGAMSFSDPYQTIPEVARILRPLGLFVFNMSSPLRDTCYSKDSDRVDQELHTSYFGMHCFDADDGVEFQLPYGEWIRLFRRNDLNVEDLIELRPPESARTTYEDYLPLDWARRWPGENIWKVRKLPRVSPVV